MKVVAFNGSPRKDGNTAILLKTVLKEIENEGIETELYQFAGKKIHGCIACLKCFKNKNRKCAFDDDIVNECIDKMSRADGIIIGSPTYFADVTSEIKAFIDRTGYVSRANDCMFSYKVGAAVVAVRRAGAIHTFDTINHFFLIGGMIIPGSKYWNIGYGRNIGDVEGDKEGMETMHDLGKKISWLLKKIGAADKI